MKCSKLFGNGVVGGIANPFVVESPEKLAPNQLVDLFVQKHTHIETVKQRKHTFIWGSRGSGKSMMLRYLEPQCQSILIGSFSEYIKQPESFFSIYMPCKEGQFNKTELELLTTSASLIITEHMLNLSVAERLLSTIIVQVPDDSYSIEECVNFSRSVLRLFDKASIGVSLSETNDKFDIEVDPILWLQDLFQNELRKVSSFLRNLVLQNGTVQYHGSTTSYHDFLLPFLKNVKNFNFLNSLPIFLMVDDADRLNKNQQCILNSWIANRDQNILCLKICSRRETYNTFLTKDKGIIEQPHDFSEIDVDELYTQSKSDYANKVKLISEKRLEIAKSSELSIERFLPPDSGELKLYEKVKYETAQEWETQGKPGRKSDYVSRYSYARLFQYLKKKKRRKSYAGFQNMVHLSSGIIRDFLEPCYLMFDQMVGAGNNPIETGFIKPNVQDDVLFRYSEYLLLTKFDDMRKDLPPEEYTHLEKLKCLVESLGRLFYERLHDKEAREARIFSFTVRDPLIPEDISIVLQLGVKYRFFQCRTYSSKEGGGREPWYILNRRLCPVYKLDPTGFEGRISLTIGLLRLAFNDPTKFVALRLKKETEDITTEQSQIPLFTLESGE